MSNTYKFVSADGSGDFGSSPNWIDETSSTTPGPPGPTDTALVETAGTISGAGDVGALTLGGTGGLLTSTDQAIVAKALELEGQVALTDRSHYEIFGDVEQAGTSTVSMSGGSDLYIAPDAETTSLEIAGASRDRSTFNLTGLGTTVEVAEGNAAIGDAGIGAMTISSGAQLETDEGGVILGGTTGGQGTLTVTGPLSALLATGDIQVDQGSLSILAGAEASSLSLSVGGTTGGSASVLVSGAGSRLTAGDAAIGGSGASSLTIAKAGFAEVRSLQVGAGGGGASHVLVEGAGSTLEIRGGLNLGYYEIGPGGQFSGGSGSLEVTSGAQVLQDSSSVDILGPTGSYDGSILVAGTGSTLNTGAASLIVGDDATGTVMINAGGDIITSTSSGPAVSVGNYATGSVTISGPGSNWTVTGEFAVGYDFGTGSVLVAAGASLETGNSDGAAGFLLGNQANGSGTATITGAGSTLTNSGAFIIGDAGAGALTISAGGGVSTSLSSGHGIDGAVIGEASGSSGKVDVRGTGSHWTVGSGLVIGSAGTGSLTVGAGATVSAASLLMAETGTGTLTVSGTSAHLTIRGNALFGDSAKASVTIGSGGLLSVGGSAEMEDGRIALTGGALSVSGTLTEDAGQLIFGHGTVQASSLINSSTVQASGGTMNFIGGITGTGKLEIEAASTLSLSGSVSSGQETIFKSAASHLVLGAPSSFSGTIYDFIKGDTIDLSKFAATSLAYSGQTLTVLGRGSAALALKFSGAYSRSSFGMTSDGHGGTIITHT